MSAPELQTDVEGHSLHAVVRSRSNYDPAPLAEDQAVPAGRQAITPAQAKIEAVANLTMKAYERASTLVLTPEEIAALQADFPDDAFKPGAAGKEHLLYIEHPFLRDRLNQVFGPGQWAIIPRNRWAEDFSTGTGKEASRVYVEAMLCVRGCFVAEAVGDMVYYKSNDSQNYGDAVEGAKTAALRRCSKEMGIGLQAWKKDWCEGWWQRHRSKPKSAADRPGRPQDAPKVRPATPAAKTPPVASQAAKSPIPEPDEKARLRWIALLKPLGQAAVDYAVEKGWILPPSDDFGGEPIECISLGHVPRTKREAEAHIKAIQAMGDSTQPPADEPPPTEEGPS